MNAGCRHFSSSSTPGHPLWTALRMRVRIGRANGRAFAMYSSTSGLLPAIDTSCTGNWQLETTSPTPPIASTAPDRAAVQVIVDQSHRLHERIHRGRPDEAPAAPLQLL